PAARQEDRMNSTASQVPPNVERGTWIHKQPGETLVGVLTDVEMATSSFTGDAYPVLELQLDGGDIVTVHCFRQVLQRQLRAKRPQIGDKLRIAYRGRAGEERDSAYLYRVSVGDEPQRIDWDTVAPESAPTAGAQAGLLGPDERDDASDVPF